MPDLTIGDIEDDFYKEPTTPQRTQIAKYLCDASNAGIIGFDKLTPIEVGYEKAFRKAVAYLIGGAPVEPEVLLSKFDSEFYILGWSFEEIKMFIETLLLPFEVVKCLDAKKFLLHLKKG